MPPTGSNSSGHPDQDPRVEGAETSEKPELLHFTGAGVQLTGERRGAENPNGIVVLIHGGGQTRHSWGRTAERLADSGWTSIAVDLRGHGDSEWHSGGDYSLDAFVADLLAVVNGLDRVPVLVGASIGGITSLVTAGEHPGIARALVLVDVVPTVEPAGVDRIRAFLTAHHDGFGSLDEVADAIAAYTPNRRRSRNLEGLKKNVRLRDDGRWYWHWDPAFIRIDDEPARHAPRQRLRAAAAALTIPTLIVRGGESDVVGDAGIADMLDLVPSAEYVYVPAAGHMVAGDDNDVFAGHLDTFLSRI
jgi:non-heme chloroperoxidase